MITDTRQAAMEMLEDGIPIRIAANYLGISEDVVLNWHMCGAYHRFEGDKIMSCHYGGMAPSQIAKELGITTKQVVKHITSCWRYEKEQKKGW